ncbi:MAG: LysE family transporter [Anaerolineae bacterium]|nr:LysE family transporter [Anaerolineae bacterium]
MWAFVGLGLSLGLSAGISPGPLLALVIAASVRNGLSGGLWVALAPFITDLPIIALAVLISGSLPPEALVWVGTVGGLVVIWMGIEALRSARRAVLPEGTGSSSDSRRELWRGAVVNALNPHPYLFWATVGGPALVSGWRSSPMHALAFLVPFYLLLVGSKMVVAWVVSRQAGGLSLTWYRRVLAGCGALMLLMGGLLIWQMWRGG